MKKILIVFLFFFVQQFNTYSALKQHITCQVFGTIYIETQKNRAHYSVYLEEYESDADLIVCKQDNRLFADRPGLWYFVTDRSFADYTIYLESDDSYADFSVYYTDDVGSVGCNR